MVILTRITEPDDAVFRELTVLYKEAFPAEERRDISQLEVMLKHEPSMFFNVVREEGKVVGLFVYWDFATFYYLEHLAIYAGMRNRKIGQQVLDWTEKHLRGSRLLEVEPAETEIAIRRIGYYRRNGYRILDKTYRQPPYRTGGEEFPLWIMGNNETLPAGVLQERLDVIRERVYCRG